VGFCCPLAEEDGDGLCVVDVGFCAWHCW
jgi:hypothetical protein